MSCSFLFLIFGLCIAYVHGSCFPRDKWHVERRTLHYPRLDEVARVLGRKLQKQFKHVQSDVVYCPDLRGEPFNLANRGMSGSTRFVHVGSISNLAPHPNFNKSYSLIDITSFAELNSAFVFGAGAGPYNQLGFSSEGYYNFNVADCILDNHSLCISLAESNGKIEDVVSQLNNSHTDLGFLGTLFASKGQPGKVVRLLLKQRINETFVLGLGINQILQKHFGATQPVAVGVVGVMRKGIAEASVVPEFTDEPVHDLWAWVHHFNTSAPFIFVGTIVTQIKGLNLYTPHFHFQNERHGGHFVNDVTPNEVEYEIFLNLAEYVYAVDVN